MMAPAAVPVMNRFLKRLGQAVAVMTLAVIALHGDAHAEFVMSISQVGSDVIGVGSGSIDTLGLTFPVSLQGPAFLSSDQANVSLGPPANTLESLYLAGASGPSSFGVSTQYTIASSGNGDRVGINGSDGVISVPKGYVSGTPLSGTSTFSDQSFASLGLTSGTYTYNCGIGAHVDSILIDVGTASVPEPSSLVLSCFAVAGAMVFRGRRQKSRRARPGLRMGRWSSREAPAGSPR